MKCEECCIPNEFLEEEALLLGPAVELGLDLAPRLLDDAREEAERVPPLVRERARAPRLELVQAQARPIAKDPI